MRRPIRCLLFCLLWAIPCAPSRAKERVFVLTDISNEPDDEQSLVRFLVYSNEYDVEGIVATTSEHLRDRTREDLIRRQIEAFGKIRKNLVKHADGYPTAEKLLAVTAPGQPGFGMKAVVGKSSSPGSTLLLKAADKDDPRPLWISVWGGANTLAKALLDAREERSGDEFEKLIAKLRVYTISDQDNAGRFLRREFPKLFYIVSPSASWREYYRATWTGISGDRHYKNGPGFRSEMVENPWLEKNVIDGHGPLGELYPKVAYIMEGDTPSYLGLIQNGLGWTESPAFGGWGGRYALYESYAESRPIWTNNHWSRDTVAVDGKQYTSDQATIWRWREHFQSDFAARMDWCVADDFEKANHNPIAVLQGDRTKKVLKIEAKRGETLTLSSAGSSDPDGDEIESRWMIYEEAGTSREFGELSAERGETVKLKIRENGRIHWKPATLHVVLMVGDGGSPGLVSYRRIVVAISD